MELSEILSPRAVIGSLRSGSKKRLLQDLAAAIAGPSGLAEGDVFNAILEREQLGPTGMGGGVAIPHARIEGIGRVAGLFAHLARPVDYESVDGQPVDLVFLLLAPPGAGSEHLKALAKVARVLRSPATCAKLRSTADPAALYAILTEPLASQAA
jgi:PTS system nitrogen regulatory IIA component